MWPPILWMDDHHIACNYYNYSGRKYIRGKEMPLDSSKSWVQELSNSVWQPYIALYMHVIYRWKALEPSFLMLRGTQKWHCVLDQGVHLGLSCLDCNWFRIDSPLVQIWTCPFFQISVLEPINVTYIVFRNQPLQYHELKEPFEYSCPRSSQNIIPISSCQCK